MKGHTEARLYTKPLRDLTPETSMGFAIIEYAEEELGEDLYPWQKWALVHMFEIIGNMLEEWTFRYRIIVLMVARQNGKTKLSKVIASFFLNVLESESIFGTSLSLEKAEETWEEVVRDQETIPALKRELRNISRTNGQKKLILKGGRSYKVGAPTRRAGRGDSNDLIIIDELREHRDWEAWSAAIASTNAKPRGLTICFTNAGDPGSVVLRQTRDTALAEINGTQVQDLGGEVDGNMLGLLEWSADEDADIDNKEAWAQANPALGYGLLTERAIISDRKTFTEQHFRSECLCQQVETLLEQPFPEGAWENGIDITSMIPDEANVWYGIDMSDDRRYTSIGVCGQREDGDWHIEVVARRVGTEWAVDWIRKRAYRKPIRLAFQSRGAPVSGLAEEICSIDGVERHGVEGTELTNGWGRFWDAIAVSEPGTEMAGRKIYHLPQPVMDAPAKTMQIKKMGGGASVPDRRKSPDDIAPLFACIMAYSAATAVAEKEKNKTYESVYAQGIAPAFA